MRNYPSTTIIIYIYIYILFFTPPPLFLLYTNTLKACLVYQLEPSSKTLITSSSLTVPLSLSLSIVLQNPQSPSGKKKKASKTPNPLLGGKKKLPIPFWEKKLIFFFFLFSLKRLVATRQARLTRFYLPRYTAALVSTKVPPTPTFFFFCGQEPKKGKFLTGVWGRGG